MASSHFSPSLRIIAEYAKSGRSSCKQCAKTIATSALRLGLVSRGPKGFDMTKWHHLECFPFKSSSESNVSTDSIKGFSLLKIKDQEELKQVINAAIKKELKVKIDDDDDGAHDEPTEKTVKELKVKRDSDDDGAHDEPTEKIVKKQKVKGDADDDGADDEPTEKIVKKQKLSDSSEGLEPKIAFSASDVKDKYKDAALPPPWKAFQTIIFLERVDGLHDSRKIAAFDFDGCLADTSVKRTGADAWSLMYSTIPEKLQKLYKDGFKLVIFTNESNIERWKNKRQAAVDSKVGRLNNFIKRVDVPIQVFIACGLSSGQPVDAYRKPKPGMWHLMERHLNSGLQVDMDSSFYVGDAAGRRKDHSDADIKFAQAVGLKFYVPEEFFPNQ